VLNPSVRFLARPSGKFGNGAVVPGVGFQRGSSTRGTHAAPALFLVRLLRKGRGLSAGLNVLTSQAWQRSLNSRRSRLRTSSRSPRNPYGSAASRRPTKFRPLRRPLRNSKPRLGACTRRSADSQCSAEKAEPDGWLQGGGDSHRAPQSDKS